MVCTTSMSSVFSAEPWMPLSLMNKKLSFLMPVISHRKNISKSSADCGCKMPFNAKSYRLGRNFSETENPYLSFDDSEHGPPQEAVLKAISELSKTEGRVGQTTNVVIGGTVTDDSDNEWLTLDQKVNSYPTVRRFTAIGTGGDDFIQAMVIAVESVLQSQNLDFFSQKGKVKQKISSGGKYVSVNIGPVEVVSSEQVQAVYNAMRRDDRMKYFL